MSWSANVWVKWDPKAQKKWNNWDWVKEWPEVKAAWSTMGDWDMSLWVETDSPEKLEQFVWQKLRNNDWVQDTKTTWWQPVWEKDAA